MALILAAPTAALAQDRLLTFSGVFLDAAPSMKLLMLGLLLAAAMAVAVGAAKLASGGKLPGGSAYLSALRAGGPLLGLLGAAYVLLAMFIGVANAPSTPAFTVLAPGFAEAALIFVLGVFAGVVAVAFHWAVEARIDRAVLRP